MLRHRVIPVLLMKEGLLYKTVKFKNPLYIGDAINAVKIFNEKEVDELVILDISTTLNGIEPDYKKINDLISEAFMPVSYGGGVKSLSQIERLFKMGMEKVILNTSASLNPNLVKQASKIFGNQSIVVSIDVKKDLFGKYRIYTHCGTRKSVSDLISVIKKHQDDGSGEIIINSIDRDGTMTGYDTELIRITSQVASIPLVACGGAGNIEHLKSAIRAGASGVAAGSMFVFQGIHKAVLISYPSYEDLEQINND